MLIRWLTKTARLLRKEDIDVSSAHVIEAARLAEALAALRERPLAGLPELTEATRAVLGDGADAPLALVHEKLIVGQVLGRVPADAPIVPLQADLEREQRRLRLRPEAARASSISTCARRTTASAAACCTASSCSASPGASSGQPAARAARSTSSGSCSGSPSTPFG